MKPKRKSFKVRLGNAHITVAPWTHPATGKDRWRFSFRETPGGPLRTRVFKLQADATAEAETQLARQAAGRIGLDALPTDRRRWLEEVHLATKPEDQRRVLDFLASLHRTAEITAAVARFLDAKISKAGETTPHLIGERKILEAMGAHFAGKAVTDIHQPDLAAWFDTRTADVAWKRKRDIRASLVGFWRWARKQGLAGQDPDTVADRLPEIGTGIRGERRILTPQEFKRLETAIDPEWRAWLVLGCFAGMRPEEICPNPKKKAAKRGLHCEEINWKFKTIQLPAVVSKGGTRPRSIPMSDALIAYLQWAGIEEGMTGPVCMRNPAKPGELARLGRLVFNGPWPQDVCRHSFGTYRNAILRNLPQVAEEMGSSVTMLHHHYHNPQPEQLGQAWFNMRPGVPVCSDNSEVEPSTASQPKTATA